MNLSLEQLVSAALDGVISTPIDINAETQKLLTTGLSQERKKELEREMRFDKSITGSEYKAQREFTKKEVNPEATPKEIAEDASATKKEFDELGKEEMKHSDVSSRAIRAWDKANKQRAAGGLGFGKHEQRKSIEPEDIDLKKQNGKRAAATLVNDDYATQRPSDAVLVITKKGPEETTKEAAEERANDPHLQNVDEIMSRLGQRIQRSKMESTLVKTLDLNWVDNKLFKATESKGPKDFETEKDFEDHRDKQIAAAEHEEDSAKGK